MDALEKIQKYKKELEEIKRQVEQDKGALKQILIRIKKDHGCSSKADAEKRLKAMRPQVKKLKKKLISELKAFERDFGRFLDGRGH